MTSLLINANALHIPLADKSVNCVVTSPPYYGLRDYGTAKWQGGDAECDHLPPNKPGPNAVVGNTTSLLGRTPYKDICGKCGAIRIDQQIGLEQTPDEYVANLVAVFREVRRVLRDDGTCWLNLGDSYGGGSGCHSGGSEKQRSNIGATNSYIPSKNGGGIKPKDLIGIPWRVAFALQADGWYLRQDIIWHKPNPMPESVKDRCTKAHEYIFLLTKSARYYYDADAIREPYAPASLPRALRGVSEDNKWQAGAPGSTAHTMSQPRENRRKEWEKEHGGGGSGFAGHSGYVDANGRLLVNPAGRNKRTVWTVTTKPYKGAHYATFPPDLIKPMILAGCPKGGIVFDPFVGSGTTVATAIKLGRKGIGIDLNIKYLTENARQRIAEAQMQPRLI